MNFLIAIVIGAVIGGVGGVVLRGRQPNALWLAPVLSIVGALAASALASAVGDPGYGAKEVTLQVALALVGVGVVAFLARSRQAGNTTASSQ